MTPLELRVKALEVALALTASTAEPNANTLMTTTRRIEAFLLEVNNPQQQIGARDVAA